MPQPWKTRRVDAPVVGSGSADEGGRCTNDVCVRIGTGDVAALPGRSIGRDHRQRVMGTVRQERRDWSDPVWAMTVRATKDGGPMHLPTCRQLVDLLRRPRKHTSTGLVRGARTARTVMSVPAPSGQTYGEFAREICALMPVLSSIVGLLTCNDSFQKTASLRRNARKCDRVAAADGRARSLYRRGAKEGKISGPTDSENACCAGIHVRSSRDMSSQSRRDENDRVTCRRLVNNDRDHPPSQDVKTSPVTEPTIRSVIARPSAAQQSRSCAEPHSHRELRPAAE